MTEENESTELLKLYVKPHTKISREVTEDDVETVEKNIPIIARLCKTKQGLHGGGYAIAHAQLDDKDPLRFYVTFDGMPIINPVITRHTRVLKTLAEGCLSFPNKGMTKVERYYKIELDFQTLVRSSESNKLVLSMTKHIDLKGIYAQIAQHEIDHMNGKYLYDIQES